MESSKSKSPRAPSLALGEAIERAIRLYDQERRHAVPTDIAAKSMGYKSANNGAALAALASLRYYGLVERIEQGKLAASRDLEAYRFAPSEQIRSQLLIQWLRAPQLFAELLDKYVENLPSEAALRYELIQRGFSPSSAETVSNVFRKSVELARYYERFRANSGGTASEARSENVVSYAAEDDGAVVSRDAVSPKLAPASVDRIPVRLSGGRRAWLEIPSPLFEADKIRIKAQIDLILTDDEGSEISDLL